MASTRVAWVLRVLLVLVPLLAVGGGAWLAYIKDGRAEAPRAKAPVDARAGSGGRNGLGMQRFKDAAVYFDGRPVGVLSFAELPAGLEVQWVEERVSAEKLPGDDSPGFELTRARRYRFVDYLRALGVPLETITAIHIHGAKSSDVIIASGDELRGATGRELMFRFGGEVFGKAIPVVPARFGNGKSPDKITAVSLYAQKKPPELVRNQGLFLDGQPVVGIPYHGEPLRGGVRLYLDNRLVAVLKRRDLDAQDEAAREGRFAFAAVLAANGIAMDQLVEGWLIHRDRREVRLTPADLAKATFLSEPGTKAVLELGGNTLGLDAVALHTKPLDQLSIR